MTATLEPDAADRALTPIDEYVARHRSMTAVERFTAHHDAPAHRWLDRLPAAEPAPGQQYAFEVDLDACTGCKACVAACHSLNGLDDGEPWRRVGTLHGLDSQRQAVVQTVTHACHHCIDPACLSGCPADAYEKDPITGIVKHLDDSCIGCSYCTLTCPYEVPAYNASLGIVRKCDLCADRLAVGEAPACVQGCPQGAITISVVDVLELTERLAADRRTALVPGAPASHLTGPTTTYRSSQPLPDDLLAADHRSVHPAAAHAPLAVMLVLTQAAVGVLLVGAWLRVGTGMDPTTAAWLATVGLVTGVVALGASVLHLGRPLLAWRAVLGIRHSWLSREIVAFGAFATVATADAALAQGGGAGAWSTATLLGAAGLGLLGVACSVQLYAVTGRSWWAWRTTAPRFAATATVGGSLGTAAVLELASPGASPGVVRTLVVAAMIGFVVGTLTPLLPLRSRLRRRALPTDLAGTAQLLRGPLRPMAAARLGLGALGAGLLPMLALGSLDAAGTSHQAGVLLALAWVVAMLGEHRERRLFFLASVAPRMPGRLQ